MLRSEVPAEPWSNLALCRCSGALAARPRDSPDSVPHASADAWGDSSATLSHPLIRLIARSAIENNHWSDCPKVRLIPARPAYLVRSRARGRVASSPWMEAIERDVMSRGHGVRHSRCALAGRSRPSGVGNVEAGLLPTVPTRPRTRGALGPSLVIQANLRGQRASSTPRDEF